MFRFSLVVLSSWILAEVAFASNPAVVNPWPKARTPVAGPAESIGKYAAGCLRGAVSLPKDGKGYQLMRLKRKRSYGHPALVKYIQDLAERVQGTGLGPLLVGDLGMARGGPTLSGHNSHQTGLDADIWFMKLGKNKKLSPRERESLSARNMVIPSKRVVDPRAFTSREITILREAAMFPEVDRIFVNYAIKKELCEKHAGSPWLRKIRPWFSHDHHFHVRLKCPSGSSGCVALDEIPAGDGCDSTLAWWFSEEAREEERKMSLPSTEPKKMPELPEACRKLVADL